MRTGVGDEARPAHAGLRQQHDGAAEVKCPELVALAQAGGWIERDAAGSDRGCASTGW
jgi:hypothetical protein